MQLPQDEAIVLVSGLAPVRASKLRHYEDENFTSRLLPPPQLDGGPYADRPRSRADDWQGQVRPLDLRQPSAGEERLFEDDSDAATDRNQMQRAANASAAVRRAHAVTRDGVDLLPSF